MPGWVQAVIAAAATITALGVLWRQVVHPGALFVSKADKIIPILEEQVEAFSGVKGAFKVLAEIQAQFRTDAGSSLKDAINRLEAAGVRAAAISEAAQVNIEAVKILAEEDRAQLAKLVVDVTAITAFMQQMQAANQAAGIIQVQAADTQKEAADIQKGVADHMQETQKDMQTAQDDLKIVADQIHDGQK